MCNTAVTNSRRAKNYPIENICLNTDAGLRQITGEGWAEAHSEALQWTIQTGVTDAMGYNRRFFANCDP